MQDARQFWNKSAKRYVKSPIKDIATYEKKLAITRQYLKVTDRILEFGCGSGATAILHAPFVEQIVASDISEVMIAIAQQNAQQAGIDNIQFTLGTLADSQAESPFDAILGLNVLHLLDDVDAAIDAIYQQLAPEGLFISSSSLIGEVNFVFRGLISAMQLFGLAPAVSRFTEAELISKLVERGFRIEQQWRSSHESVFIVARKQ